MTIVKVKIPWYRYGTICHITELKNKKFPEVQFGKTAMQKIVFLLQQLFRVELGYSYDFYSYGPFSSELARDLDYTDYLKGISIESCKHDMGYEISPGVECDILKNKADNFIRNNEDKLEEVIDQFGSYQAKELEIRSTIVFINNTIRDRKELINTVSHLKPQFSVSVIEKACEELLNKGYISFDS